MALNNVQFLVPVDGGVSKLQAVLPPAAWYIPPLIILYTNINEINKKNKLSLLMLGCIIFIFTLN